MQQVRRQQRETASGVTTPADIADTDRCPECRAFQSDTRGHCDNCGAWL